MKILNRIIIFLFILFFVTTVVATQREFSLQQLEQFLTVAKDPELQQRLQLMIALMQGKGTAMIAPLQQGALVAQHQCFDYKPTPSIVVNVQVTNKSEFERSKFSLSVLSSLSALPSDIKKILELTLLLISLYGMYKLWNSKDDFFNKVSDYWEPFKRLFPKIDLPDCFSILKYFDYLKLPKCLDFLEMLKYPNSEGSQSSNGALQERQSQPATPQLELSQLKNPEVEKVLKELQKLVEEIQKATQVSEAAFDKKIEKGQRSLDQHDIALQTKVVEYTKELKKALRHFVDVELVAKNQKAEDLARIVELKAKFFDLANKQSLADEEEKKPDAASESDTKSNSSENSNEQSDELSDEQQKDLMPPSNIDQYHGLDSVIEANEQDIDKHFEKGQVGVQKSGDVYKSSEQEQFDDAFGGEFDANEELYTYDDKSEDEESLYLSDQEEELQLSIDGKADEHSSEVTIDQLKKMFEDKAEKLQGLEQKMTDALKKEQEQAPVIQFIEAEIESRKNELVKADQKLDELEKKVDAITNKNFVRVDINLDMPFKAMLVGRDGDLNDDVNFTISLPFVEAASMRFSEEKTYCLFEELFYEYHGQVAPSQNIQVKGNDYVKEIYLIQPASKLSEFIITTERNDLGVLYYVIAQIKDKKKIYFLKKNQCNKGVAIISRPVLLNGKVHRFIFKFNKSNDLSIERILVEA